MKTMLAAATAALLCQCMGAQAAAEFKIATADKRGSYSPEEKILGFCN